MGSVKFAIVTFTSDDTTEIVPDNWLSQENTKCYFPDGITSGRVKKFVKRMEEPNAVFKLYDCKVIKRFESYDEAKEMLPRVLRDSDMSSMETPRRKRARIVPRSLPIPPASSFAGSQDEAQSSQELSQVNIGNPVSSAESTIEQLDFARQPTFVLVSSDGFPVDNNDQSTSYHQSIYHSEANVSSVLAPVCSSSSCATFQKDVTDKLEKIYQLQKMHGESINSIMGLMKASRSGSTSSSKFHFPTGMFPIRSLDQLAALNTLIEGNPDAYEQLVSMVRLSGGTKVEEGLKLASKELISDEVLSSHCYKGQSDKVSFLKYGSLLKGFQEGLNQNSGISEEASKEKIDRGMAKVLKLAADRVFQRKKIVAAKVSNTDDREEEERQ